jgi:hypothetical protein
MIKIPIKISNKMGAMGKPIAPFSFNLPAKKFSRFQE